MKWGSNTLPVRTQFLMAITSVLVVSGLCFYATAFIGYKVVALILLTMVSLLALLFDIIPVLVSAVLSAFIWNLLFIPPIFTFHIAETEDLLMFLLYFLIALVHAVLTFKIKQAERKAALKKENENAIKLYHTVFNSLSHELRTPIATLIGAVDTLKQQQTQLNEQQTAALLDEIETAGMRLNRQVENLLNIGRLESGMLQPKADWCDMPELVHTVLQKFNPLLTQNIHLVTQTALPLFKLDIGIVDQVLYNLLHNAVQYTPANTRIEIEIKTAEDACVLIVRDYGKGLSAEERKNIFRKFYRLSASSSDGVGLGLSIVKGFVESLGGNVIDEEVLPSGLSFTVSIPCEISYINRLKNE